MNFLRAARDWILDDFLWKAFSVLIAMVIWLTVHRILVGGQGNGPLVNAQAVTFYNLPVIVVARAADVHSYRVRPDSVTVTVSGSPEAVNVLQAGSVRVSVDLTDIESAKDLYKTVDVSMPPGITLVKVTPPLVNVVMPRPNH